MANITANVNITSVDVTNTPSNIVITEEGNSFVANVVSTTTAVNVASTVNTINVAALASVANSAVRTAINVANVSGFGNINYDNTISSNGVISYIGVSNSDILSVVDDNPANIRQHISVSDNGGFGSLTYSNITGILQYTGPSELDVRGTISAVDIGGDGSLTYNSTTGQIVYTGPSAAEVRLHLSATSNITYSNTTGVIGQSLTTDDITEGTTNLFLNGAGTTDDLTEGTTNLYYSNTRVANWISTEGGSDRPFEIWTGSGTDFGDIWVGDIRGGDITASGAFGITVNSDGAGGIGTTTLISDNYESGVLRVNHTGAYPSIPAGNVFNIITLNTSNATVEPSIGYKERLANGSFSNTWQFSNDASTYYPLPTSTTDLVEGDNLYWTTARGNAALVAYLGDSNNAPFSINGNLDVAGNLNYENVTDLYVTDQKITLNANAVSDATVEIIANRPVAGSNAILRWNETTDKWEFTDGANTYTMARTTDDLPETSGNLYLNPTNLASTTLSTNLKVKHFSETVAELGNISGNVTIPLANGSIANATLTGNVETISFSGLSAGSRASIILNQDSAGNHKVLTPDIPAPTGGTVSIDGDYVYHTFTTDDTLDFFGDMNIEYLVVGGGGPGGRSSQGAIDASGGGGGAGEYIAGNISVSADQTFSISIGAGGDPENANSNATPTNGGNTSFGNITAIGGGAGGSYRNPLATNRDGADGGSGGGYLSYTTTEGNAGVSTAVTGSGNDGGTSAGNGKGSGGGGAGGNTTDGSGGAGIQWSDGNFYAAGGAAGTDSTTLTPPSGGSGIGGDGGSHNGSSGTAPTAGTANTGSGGGGGGTNTSGPAVDDSHLAGAGGSGIVIVRYNINELFPGYSGDTAWLDWYFEDSDTEVTSTPHSKTLVEVMYDGYKYYSTFKQFDATSGEGIKTINAGAGLTGGGSSGTVTLDAVGGYGITVNADDIEFANSVLTTLTSNITTTANIQADYFIADTEFIGDIEGAISENVFNDTASTLTKGSAVYISGAQGDKPNVALANAQNAAHMPAMGIVKENISASSEGQVVISGVMNFSSHGFTIGASLWVNGAGVLQETKPTSEANLIQKIAKVIGPNHILVQGAGRSNETPNLDDGNIFVGNTSNQAVTADLSNFTYEINSSANIETSTNLKGSTLYANTITTNGNDPIVLQSADFRVDNQNFEIYNDAAKGKLLMVDAADNSGGPDFDMQKARGGFGSEEGVVPGDNMFNFLTRGYHTIGGGLFRPSSLMGFVVDPTYEKNMFYTNGVANYLVPGEFRITSDYHIANDPEFRIRNDGSVRIEGNGKLYADDPVLNGIVTVGNGAENKFTAVGDIELKIARADNSANATMGVASWVHSNSFGNNVLVEFWNTYSGDLPDSTAITLGNTVSVASELGNITTVGTPFYTKNQGAGATGLTLYELFTDSGLTNAAQWSDYGATIPQDDVSHAYGGNVEYAVTPSTSITDRNYIFRLSEASEDLVLSTNGSDAVTFHSNADISTNAIDATRYDGKLRNTPQTLTSPANLSGAVSLDVTNGSIFKATVVGDITSLALTNAESGHKVTLILTQGTTTGTLSAGANWLWAGGNRTLSNVTGKIDVIEATYDGTYYYATLNTDFSTDESGTPDWDGGTASTTSFEFTADGGNASTTSFADTVSGGNAAGNAITAGGFAGTTVFGSTVDGGSASTASFDTTIDGGNA